MHYTYTYIHKYEYLTEEASRTYNRNSYIMCILTMLSNKYVSYVYYLYVSHTNITYIYIYIVYMYIPDDRGESRVYNINSNIICILVTHLTDIYHIHITCIYHIQILYTFMIYIYILCIYIHTWRKRRITHTIETPI